MKKTLLDFSYALFEDGEAIYLFDRGILNPLNKEFTEVEKTEYKQDNFTLSDLRRFVEGNRIKLTENGNIIKGEIKNKKINLTILKEND